MNVRYTYSYLDRNIVSFDTSTLAGVAVGDNAPTEIF